MQVSFPTSNNKKTNFTQEETSMQPQVTLQNPDEQYTLVMIDPDAGNKTPDTYYLHWLIVNIPRGGDVMKGDILVPYAPPTPPAGTGQHRYIFILYKQSASIVTGQIIRYRAKWSLPNFLKDKQGVLQEVARKIIHVPRAQNLNGNS